MAADTAVAKRVEAGAVAPVSDEQSFLSFIADAARDPAVDVSKMERLFEMREKMIDRQAHMEFNAALKQAKAQMPAIFRNKKNEQTNSHYANLESVSDAMDPIITKNGFALSFGTDNSPLPNHYRVTCTLTHEGGHEKEYFADIPIDSAGMKGTQNKTLTHAFGSTMSYGRRYLKMMIFDVKTTDDDGNAAGSAYVTDEQAMEIETLLGHTKANREAFLKWVKADSVETIQAKNYAGAVAKLKAKRDAQ